MWMLIAVITPLVGFLGARGYAPLVGAPDCCACRWRVRARLKSAA
ncbi:MAG: hypothetical protein WDN45_17530 [Caulobacteraceae bacterium]